MILQWYAPQTVQISVLIIEQTINIFVVSGRVSITGTDETAHPGGAGKTIRWWGDNFFLVLVLPAALSGMFDSSGLIWDNDDRVVADLSRCSFSVQPKWLTSWLSSSQPTWRVQRAAQDHQALQVRTAVLDALDPLESLVCPGRVEEKDPGDPWALKVGPIPVLLVLCKSFCSFPFTKVLLSTFSIRNWCTTYYWVLDSYWVQAILDFNLNINLSNFMSSME